MWVAAILAGLATSMHYYAVSSACRLPLRYALAWPDATTARRLAADGQGGGDLGRRLPSWIAVPACRAVHRLRDIRANRQIVIDRAVESAARWFPSAGDYARMLAVEAVGWPIALLAVAGIVALARSRPRLMWLLASFPLLFLLFISNTVAATRYLNPVLPFVAIAAGIGLAALGDAIRTARARVVAVAAAAVLAAWPALAASLRTGTFFRQEDTRSLALDFVRTHVPEGATASWSSRIPCPSRSRARGWSRR